jgi:cytochrome c peroxidase
LLLLGATEAQAACSNVGRQVFAWDAIRVPKPSNFCRFVKDEAAAIRLGKAWFWDMQVGSDGLTACASCHFHAGADNRVKN